MWVGVYGITFRYEDVEDRQFIVQMDFNGQEKGTVPIPPDSYIWNVGMADDTFLFYVDFLYNGLQYI